MSMTSRGEDKPQEQQTESNVWTTSYHRQLQGPAYIFLFCVNINKGSQEQTFPSTVKDKNKKIRVTKNSRPLNPYTESHQTPGNGYRLNNLNFVNIDLRDLLGTI